MTRKITGALRLSFLLACALALASPAFGQITLESGEVYTYSTSPEHFQYFQTQDHWSVVGLRSLSTSDYGLELYEESNYLYWVALSNYEAPDIDFIVGDYHHNATPQWDYRDPP